MTLQSLFTIALYALTALLLVLLGATSARKALRTGRERRRRRLEAEVRPALMRYLVAEEDDPTALSVTGRGGESTLRGLALGLLPKLRGADRDALVSVLASRGVISRAQRRTHRPGAVGRARAAELLGTARTSGAFPALERLLADAHADVRIVAARALGKLGEPAAVRPLLATLGGRRPIPASVVTMALLHIGPPAAGELLTVLPDAAASPVARRSAAELLGLFGAVEAVDALIAALGSDRDSDTRAAAARSLGRVGLPGAIEPLLAALRDGDGHLRAAAAAALGEVGGPEALPALSAALGDEHLVARQAAQALARHGATGRRVLYAAVAAASAGAGEAREAIGGLNRASRSRRAPARRPAVAG